MINKKIFLISKKQLKSFEKIIPTNKKALKGYNEQMFPTTANIWLFHEGGAFHIETMDWFLYDRDLRRERVNASGNYKALIRWT